METVQKILLVITIMGAVNLGLMGILDMDLVAQLFGTASFLTRTFYTIVGVCGLVNIGILLGHIDFKRD